MNKNTDVSHELKVDLNKDSRETFIPIRHGQLALRLTRRFEMSEPQSQSFLDLCERLQSIFHVEHLSALIAVEDLYGPLDPDSELIQTEALSYDQLAQRTETLFEQVADLAFAAHYQRLSREELERMIKLGTQRGIKLEVDFEVFDRLEIFARGYRMVDVKRRRWQTLYREETIQLPEFYRLILTFRLKPDEPTTNSSDKKKKRKIDKTMRSDSVYIKIFKNIPETDLEVLLPGTRVKLSKLDQGKILLPTLAGAAIKIGPTLLNIVRGLAGITIVFTLMRSWHFWGIAIAAMIGYVAKSVFTYFRTKDKYEFNLTKNLYLKNLDNNAGVLYRLLNEAQEQELCETMIGYTVLWRNDSSQGIPELEIDRLAEEFLLKETGHDVDFDLHDALGKLARLGLANVDSAGNWTAVPIESAAGNLVENWERLFKKRVVAKKTDGLDDNLLTS